MGLTYRKLNRRRYIMESQRIERLRIEYMAQIAQYRRLGRNIVYLDETWFDTHDIKTHGLSDDSSKCVLRVPASRGKRVIILHVGGSNGWVQNGLLVSAKNIKNCNADYHEDMSSSLFEEWFQKQLLPNIPRDTVVVMDNAPSHSRLAVKIPNTSTRKGDTINFLSANNIEIPPDAKTKPQLLELVRAQNVSKKYVVDEMAKSYNCVVLRLPPYFCIFNPIELIWSDLKRGIRKFNNNPESSPAVIDIIRKQVDSITTEKWQNCIKHVANVELSYQTIPNVNIVINVNNPDSESSSSDSDN